MTLKQSLEKLVYSLLLMGSAVTYSASAQDYVATSLVNVPNGVAGLDENGKVTSNIDNQSIDTQSVNAQSLNTQSVNTQSVNTQSLNSQGVNAQMMQAQLMSLVPDGRFRISTTSDSPSDSDIIIFFNHNEQVGLGTNYLQANTLYFTSAKDGGDHYRFKGDITATRFRGILSTPSSSSAPCSEGEFVDDANYHYVCVSANKWKRVALSDF